MMKNGLITLLLCVAFFTHEAAAQSWSKAIGLRLGYPNSVTYKQFVSEKAAVEAMVGTRGFPGGRSLNAGVALQLHNSLLEDSFGGLRWYYGAGAGIATYSFKNNFTGGGNSSASIFVQGFLGVDYTFEDVPINLSLDWVPTFFINGFGKGFGADSGSLAIRYIF